MSYEAQNETQAHIQSVVAAAIPLFGEDLSQLDRAELKAYMQALKTHLHYTHRQELWHDEEGFKYVYMVATCIGRDIFRTWDGDDYDWNQGVERFMQRLNIRS